jgi:hypothetical protein
MEETPNEQYRRLTQAQPGKSKYKNKRISRDGINYDSQAEYAYKGVLDMMVAAGEIKGYDYHVKLPLIAEGGEVIGHYEVDYLVYLNNGSQELHDVKSNGTITPVFRLKAKHVKAQYGHEVILIDSKTLKPKASK